MDGRTAAAVLGITQEATRDEIRRAFRARAKRAHPDADGTDEAFVTLRAAADLLLATAPLARTVTGCASADRIAGSGLAAVDAVSGMEAMAAAGDGCGSSRTHGTVGRRPRWEHRPTARCGAAIDLTDRPAGNPKAAAAAVTPKAAAAAVTPKAAAAAVTPKAAAAAFARLLEAELARP